MVAGRYVDICLATIHSVHHNIAGWLACMCVYFPVTYGYMAPDTPISIVLQGPRAT